LGVQVLTVTTAGVVASATGAHFTNSEITAAVLQNGATAGAIQATLVVLAIFVWQERGQKLWVYPVFVLASFGLNALTAAIISQRTLGQGKEPSVIKFDEIS
jgi:hypothetical protein